MKVKDFNIENTGGSIYVAWGSFENGNYFSISSDILLVYDEDEYKAMDEDSYDGYDWENKHTIESYTYTCDEYLDVLKQIYNQVGDSQRTVDLFNGIEEE